jgi:hypothetical protein
MNKLINWLLFDKNGQLVLILIAALCCLGILQNDIPQFR